MLAKDSIDNGTHPVGGDVVALRHGRKGRMWVWFLLRMQLIKKVKSDLHPPGARVFHGHLRFVRPCYRLWNSVRGQKIRKLLHAAAGFRLRSARDTTQDKAKGRDRC